jgi:hypothetical protein
VLHFVLLYTGITDKYIIFSLNLVLISVLIVTCCNETENTERSLVVDEGVGVGVEPVATTAKK